MSRIIAFLTSAALVLASGPVPAAAHYITPAGYRVEWTGAGQMVNVYDQSGALVYTGAATLNAGGRLVPPPPLGDGAPDYYYFDRPDIRSAEDVPREKITGFWGEVPIRRGGKVLGWGVVWRADGRYRVAPRPETGLPTDRWLDTWAGPYYEPSVTVPTPIDLPTGGGEGGSSPPSGPAPVEITSLSVPTVVYGGDPISVQAVTSGPVASVTASIYSGSAALTNTAPGTWSGTLAAPTALGTYTITVTATGSSGQTASRTASIDVVQAPPRVVFAQNPILWRPVQVVTAAPPGPLYRADPPATYSVPFAVYAPTDTVAVAVYDPSGAEIPVAQAAPGQWTGTASIATNWTPPGDYPYAANLVGPGGTQMIQGTLHLIGRPIFGWLGAWGPKTTSFVGIYRGGITPPTLTATVYFPDGQSARWGENVCRFSPTIDITTAKWWPCWTPDPSWSPAEGRYSIRSVIGDSGGPTDSQAFDLLMPLSVVRAVYFTPDPASVGGTVTVTVYTSGPTHWLQVYTPNGNWVDATDAGNGAWQATFTAPPSPGTYQITARTFGLNDPLIPDNTTGHDGMPNGFDDTPDDARTVALTVQ